MCDWFEIFLVLSVEGSERIKIIMNTNGLKEEECISNCFPYHLPIEYSAVGWWGKVLDVPYMLTAVVFAKYFGQLGIMIGPF